MDGEAREKSGGKKKKKKEIVTQRNKIREVSESRDHPRSKSDTCKKKEGC